MKDFFTGAAQQGVSEVAVRVLEKLLAVTNGEVKLHRELDGAFRLTCAGRANQ